MRRDEGSFSKRNGGRGSSASLAHLGALGVVLCSVSCGSKGAVAVTPLIQNPVMAVSAPSSLASTLNGSFNLHLDLGPAASSGVDVSLAEGSFNLVDPARPATLVLLKFTTNPPAPFHLEPGGKLDIAFTVADNAGMPGQFITKDEAASICAARAAVQIAGSFTDSVNGSTPVNSGSFAVSCP